MNGMRNLRWLLSLLVIAFVLAGAGTASALCVEPGPIRERLRQAETVFVGTVTGLAHEGRVATFQVEEIWKGTVGASAVVNGGPSLAALEDAQEQGLVFATSTDRSYVVGESYLVVPHRGDGDTFADSACSATRIFTDRLARHRPESAEVLIAGAPPADSEKQPQPPQSPEVPVSVAPVPEEDGGSDRSDRVSRTLATTTVFGASALAFVIVRHKRRRSPASDDEA